MTLCAQRAPARKTLCRSGTSAAPTGRTSGARNGRRRPRSRTGGLRRERRCPRRPSLGSARLAGQWPRASRRWLGASVVKVSGSALIPIMEPAWARSPAPASLRARSTAPAIPRHVQGLRTAHELGAALGAEGRADGVRDRNRRYGFLTRLTDVQLFDAGHRPVTDFRLVFASARSDGGVPGVPAPTTLLLIGAGLAAFHIGRQGRQLGLR